MLIGADLSSADLSQSILKRANLDEANLYDTVLSRANLEKASLINCNLHLTELDETNLRGTNLCRAILRAVSLNGADLTGAELSTIFAYTDLSETRGLDKCIHRGSSVIDYNTLADSWPLPLNFLRGCGLPDNLIDYLPSLLNRAFEFYSCFISYSSKDERFVRRLHADLQNSGVRCWLAPEDMKWGAKQWDAINEAIRVRDKVLLVLSRNSIQSPWVEDEVNKAFAEERKRRQVVLFPVRIDDTVMRTQKPWAVKLRNDRNIGDFRNWINPDTYDTGLMRTIKDLTVERKRKVRQKD